MSKSTKTWNIPREFSEHSKGPRVSFSKKILPPIQIPEKITINARVGGMEEKMNNKVERLFKRVIVKVHNMFSSPAATHSKTGAGEPSVPLQYLVRSVIGGCAQRHPPREASVGVTQRINEFN